MKEQEESFAPMDEFTAVSARTGVSIEDLHQLPEESLTAYYNETSTLASGKWAMVSAAAAFVTAIASGLCFNNSDGGVLTAVGVTLATLSAANWALAGKSFYGVINNQEVAGKIQSEIGSVSSEDKPPIVRGCTEVPTI